MNMLWTPGVVMIAPRICARPNSDKTVAPFFIGERLAHAREIRIQRRIVLVDFVEIAPSCVGLPDFHQRLSYRAPIFVQHAATHYNSLAKGLTFTLMRKIKCFWRHNFLAKY